MGIRGGATSSLGAWWAMVRFDLPSTHTHVCDPFYGPETRFSAQDFLESYEHEIVYEFIQKSRSVKSLEIPVDSS